MHRFLCTEYSCKFFLYVSLLRPVSGACLLVAVEKSEILVRGHTAPACRAWYHSPLLERCSASYTELGDGAWNDGGLQQS